MRAFVTGGSGFVGRTLIEMLRARGDDVHALARSDRAAATVEQYGASVVRGDINDVQAMREGMRGCDVVFHAAAKVDVWGTRAEFQRVTIDGTQAVVDAARAAGATRLVHVSTEAVLIGGRKLVQADETWPLPSHPLGLYPWSKGRAEEIVRSANRDGLTTVIVRPRAIWGKGDTTLAPKLKNLAEQDKFAWIGGGRHLTSTCHVRNVCACLILAAERGRAGEVYFVSDGPPITMRAYIGGILPGVPLGNRSIPLPIALVIATLVELVWQWFRLRGEPPLTRTSAMLVGQEVTVSDAKARRELGYVPVITREAGFAELAAQVADV